MYSVEVNFDAVPSYWTNLCNQTFNNGFKVDRYENGIHIHVLNKLREIKANAYLKRHIIVMEFESEADFIMFKIIYS